MISTHNESSLHAGLKRLFAQSGDEIEAPVGNYIIDIKRGNLLIEIQTANLYAMRKKITDLSPDYAFHIIRPIIRTKYIVTVDVDGTILRRRRSSRQGRFIEALKDLNNYPEMLGTPNLTLQLLLIDAEEYRTDDGKGSWRRKGVSITDRNLLDVIESTELHEPSDARLIVPELAAETFTNRDIATACKVRLYNARWYSGALRKMGLIRSAGKRRRETLYEWV